MSKNLIVIGNGFDLYCGINSKFSNFFKYSKQNNQFYRIFMDNVLNDGSQYALLNPENAFRSGKIPKFSSEFSFIDALFILIFENKKIDYWNDVEGALYEEIVNNHPISLSKISYYVSKNKSYKQNANSIKLSDKEKLLAVMIDKQIDTTDFYNEYILEQLRFFEERFGEYIYSQISAESQIARYHKEVRNALMWIFDPQKGEYSPDKNDSGTIICSFNYIDISKAGLDEFDVENIHGSLKNSDLIIGITDNKYNPLYDKLTKSKRRFLLVEHNTIDYSGVTTVRLFGHSFNKQDYYYFISLFNNIDLVNRYKDITFVILYSQHDNVDIEKIRRNNINNFTDMLSDYFRNVVHRPDLFDNIASNVKSYDITKKP